MGAEWNEDEHRSAHSVMKYEYRVTCDAHYYGAGCATLCRPRDDNFGHYTCSEAGHRVCLSGWQGDYCTKRKLKINLFSLFLFYLINLNGYTFG